jgi:hypothetical protein
MINLYKISKLIAIVTDRDLGIYYGLYIIYILTYTSRFSTTYRLARLLDIPNGSMPLIPLVY